MRQGVRTGGQSVYLALGRQILRSESPSRWSEINQQPPGGVRNEAGMCRPLIWVWQRRPEGQRRAWGGRERRWLLAPQRAEGIPTPLQGFCCGRLARLRSRRFTSTSGDSEAQPGWASLGKGWKHIAFQGKIALGHWAQLTLTRMLILSRGLNLQWSFTFPCYP